MAPNHTQVIKDYGQTLYSAGFVPAAHVYFSCAGEPGHPVLRQEVLSGISPAPPRQYPSHLSSSEGTAGAEQTSAVRSDRSGQGSRQADGLTKKPRWLKLGK